METELNLFHKYPLLSTWDNLTIWTGVLKLENDFFSVRIHVPSYPSLEGLVFDVGDEVVTLLEEASVGKKDLQQMVTRSSSLVELLDSFTDLLSQRKNRGAGVNIILNTSVYERVREELQFIDKNGIETYTQNLGEIVLTHTDPSGRPHRLEIKVPPGYPHETLGICHSLPSNDMQWPSQIKLVYKEFARLVERFDLFWTEMDIIDSSIACFDPLEPSRAHTHRRILLDKNIVMYMKVNPNNPKEFPVVNFHGKDTLVEALNEELLGRISKWNPGCSVLENLQGLIAAELPEKGSISYCEDDLRCVICYLYEFDGFSPDISCECGSFFHSRCLQEMKNQHDNEQAAAGPMLDKDKINCPCCSMEIRLTVGDLT